MILVGIYSRHPYIFRHCAPPQDYIPLAPTTYKEDEDNGVLTYTPQTETDYGTIHCYGSNIIGIQTKPCVLHVIPAGELVLAEWTMGEYHWSLSGYQVHKCWTQFKM